MNQFNKTSERLDKLERAQAEPAAKIAKLSEAVDKLRAAAAAVPACGFCILRREGDNRLDRIYPAQQTAAASAAPKVDAKPTRRPKSAGCRRWTAGCCAMSPMAAP